MDCCPLVFEPRHISKVWGGRRLEAVLGRRLPEGQAIGESWECADLPTFSSVVARGPMQGWTLRELVAAWGGDLLGGAALVAGRFPLLIKFLDAAANLSIQVHPGKGTAGGTEGASRLKNEAWYIVQADPGAGLYRGLAPGVTVESLRQLLEDKPGEVVARLMRYSAQAGDTFYLPGGTPHALGAGLVVAEVQTPSDVTYRLYDWGRTRPAQDAGLHIAEALACIKPNPDFSASEPNTKVPGPFASSLRRVACDRFIIDECQHPGGAAVAFASGRLKCWILLAGEGEIGWAAVGRDHFTAGEVILWPAAVRAPRLCPTCDCRWLEVSVPLGDGTPAIGVAETLTHHCGSLEADQPRRPPSVQ